MKNYFIPFDIETIPIQFESLDESQQDYLIRGANTQDEIEKRKYEMALSPITGQIITIGLKVIEQNIDKEKKISYKIISSGALIVDPDMDENDEPIKQNFGNDLYFFTTERNILKMFWDVLKKYNNSTLISFNGRNFDSPYIMLRSALLNVKPSRNIMDGTKFNYQNHIDLIDVLTFYSASHYGATRRYNFDFYTRAFGLESPKAKGVDGGNVHEYFAQKDYNTIAEYCLRDVEATWQLYLRIKDYLFL